jgi:hypothetical protein
MAKILAFVPILLRDRCCDFKKIRQKMGEKMAFLTPRNTVRLFKIDHNIGYREKRHFFEENR